MEQHLEHLIDEVLHLNPESRIQLVERVLDSLPEDSVNEAWLDEVERRSKEWEAGLAEEVDPIEMIREARALIRK